MNRTLAGIFGFFLLIAGGTLFFWQPGWDSSQAISAGCLRMGAVITAIWVAYPELRRIPPWFGKVALGAALLIAVRPILALYLIPLLMAYAVLRPRTKPAARSDSANSRAR